MKHCIIICTNGEKVLVDKEDFELLNKRKWKVRNGYPMCQLGPKGKQKRIMMHHYIFPWAIMLDHIDGNKLNNQKDNLRAADKSLNGMNRGKPRNNTSGYKGVSWNKRDKYYETYITLNQIRYRLGYFKCKHEAAKAYNKAALKYHGKFARLNIIKDEQ